MSLATPPGRSRGTLPGNGACALRTCRQAVPLKSIAKLNLTVLGCLVLAGISATIGTIAYKDLTAPRGSLVFPVGAALEPS